MGHDASRPGTIGGTTASGNGIYVAKVIALLDLLVVCDVVASETAEMADVVLPVTQWAEEDGTMTSLEGRVLRRRRAVDPPSGVRSDLDVLAGLARVAAAAAVLATVDRRIAVGRVLGVRAVQDSASLLHGRAGRSRAAERFLESAGVLPDAATRAVRRTIAGPGCTRSATSPCR